MLKQVFTKLTGNYSDNATSVKLWNEIVINYNDAGRYYHTIGHINTIYRELSEVRDCVEDWDVLLLALFYHDIIYNVKRSDNEAESANLARERLQSTSLSDDRIKRCVLHILATKGHATSDDHDTNLFTDADLSILGQSPDVYKEYVKQVRKEYFVYPDIAYNKGRKKVLEYFLTMEKIFKTDFFYKKYEIQARENLERELALIGS